MLSPVALLAAGVPPLGRGVFARATVPPGPWAWVAIVGNARNYRETAAEVRRRGHALWLYSMPGDWRPDTWRAGLALLVERARELGAEGIIADPENGWPELARETRRAELAELGRALAEVATSMRVGVSSFPLIPDLDALASATGERVFGVPQMYDRHAPETDAELARWYARWTALFGPRVIPAVAGWVAGTRHATAAGYRSYLEVIARVAPAAGAAVWPEGIPLPSYMTAELSRWEPGGSDLGTFAKAVEVALVRLPVLAGLVVLLVLALLSVLATKVA